MVLGFGVIFGIERRVFCSGRVVAVGVGFEFAIGLQLLLYCFLHTDGVHNQFEMLKDFGFVPSDVAFDGIVAKQLGQVALGDHQIEQVRAVVFFGILYVSS